MRGPGPAAPVVPRRPARSTASRSGSPRASTSTRRACTRNAARTTRPLVTNPSLLLLADVLGRPELRDAVERNLEPRLDLIRPDGTVETVQSRRQDQDGRVPAGAVPAADYRLLAIRTGRGDFARAARLAAADGIDDPGLLAELLLGPRSVRRLAGRAGATPRRARYVHASARLAAHASRRPADTVRLRRLGLPAAPPHPLGTRLRPDLPAPVRGRRRPRLGAPLAGVLRARPVPRRRHPPARRRRDRAARTRRGRLLPAASSREPAPGRRLRAGRRGPVLRGDVVRRAGSGRGRARHEHRGAPARGRRRPRHRAGRTAARLVARARLPARWRTGCSGPPWTGRRSRPRRLSHELPCRPRRDPRRAVRSRTLRRTARRTSPGRTIRTSRGRMPPTASGC